MKLIYVAGPFRAKDRWQQAKQIRHVEDVGFLLAELGAVPVMPHTMFGNWDGTLNDRFWLDATLDLLRRCDGAVFVDGWEKSEGCRGEMTEAQRCMPHIWFEESARQAGLIGGCALRRFITGDANG